MPSDTDADFLLVSRIRRGEPEAWTELIARFEGRLLAFAESRVGRKSASEDVVQEAFVGFLTSLPNYDLSRSLESYLFSITAHKLTDYLRREGRRPALSLSSTADGDADRDMPGGARVASSMARSAERRTLERESLAMALRDLVNHWRNKGDWYKIRCMEMLYLQGKGNKEAAGALGLSEQQVANLKHDFMSMLRTRLKRVEPDPEVFPELYAGDKMVGE